MSKLLSFSHLEREGRFNLAGLPLPLLVTPNLNLSGTERFHSLNKWLDEEKSEVDRLLKLHGAILFRDFDISTANDFSQVVKSTGLQGMDYVGGAAPRHLVTERVFTANESPSSEKIPFHHEMAQTPEPPTHLLFYCEQPAEEGGETPLLQSANIFQWMSEHHPQFMSKLEQHGVKYIRFLPEEDDPTSAIGRGWKSTFLTDTKEGAEKALRELGSTWEWLEDGTLKTVTKALPAIRTDSGEHRTQSRNFFNSIVAAYTGWNDSRNVGSKAVVFGDDTPCDPAVISDAARVMDEICAAFKWKKGDVVLIDNRTIMHARRPFTGARRILASLVRDPER